ncbi:MAG: potassium transporter TrkG [Paracoccaceae bacterium]
MLAHLRHYPLFVLLTMAGGVAMLIPAAQSLRNEQWLDARIFFQSGLLICALATLVGLAMMNRKTRDAVRSHLTALLLAFTVLPAILALPVVLLVDGLSWFEAWFEMLSSITTTGASLFDEPFLLPEAVHLWRATVGWFGGFLILLAGFAVMQPLNLGGYEIRSMVEDKAGALNLSQDTHGDGSDRIIRLVQVIAPAYLGMTAILVSGLVIAGERVYIAFCHGMSIISTSGISPVGGLSGGASGRMGEVIMAVFLLIAINARLILLFQDRGWRTWIRRDPELRLAGMIVGGMTIALFLRHWIGAMAEEQSTDYSQMLSSIWGAMFTTLSYLTTTGFESRDWGAAQSWSGLNSPEIIFLGLAVIGGGVATTAGGVKLLRVFALFKHSTRELERLVYVNSVGRSGIISRRVRREGAYIAWIFLMLFAMSIALIAMAISLTGPRFEDSITLAIAALTNTGPVIHSISGHTTTYSEMSGPGLGILGLAMVLGRFELLAVIAMFNPNFWRR